MRYFLAYTLILVGAVASAGVARPTFDEEVVIAKAQACTRVQLLTGKGATACFDNECAAAKVQATKILEEATEVIKPPLVKRPNSIFLNGGRTMVDPDDRVWTLSGVNTWVLSPCRYIDGQVVCPNKR